MGIFAGWSDEWRTPLTGGVEEVCRSAGFDDLRWRCGGSIYESGYSRRFCGELFLRSLAAWGVTTTPSTLLPAEHVASHCGCCRVSSPASVCTVPQSCAFSHARILEFVFNSMVFHLTKVLQLPGNWDAWWRHYQRSDARFTDIDGADGPLMKKFSNRFLPMNLLRSLIASFIDSLVCSIPLLAGWLPARLWYSGGVSLAVWCRRVFPPIALQRWNRGPLLKRHWRRLWRHLARKENIDNHAQLHRR